MTVIKLHTKTDPIIGSMAAAIEQLLYDRFTGQSCAAVIGALEMVKMKLFLDMNGLGDGDEA